MQAQITCAMDSSCFHICSLAVENGGSYQLSAVSYQPSEKAPLLIADG
jgi:hypothetical protein